MLDAIGIAFDEAGNPAADTPLPVRYKAKVP